MRIAYNENFISLSSISSIAMFLNTATFIAFNIFSFLKTTYGNLAKKKTLPFHFSSSLLATHHSCFDIKYKQSMEEELLLLLARESKIHLP